MRREAAARQAVEDARLDVIRACGELREAEMFLDAVKADERAAVGGEAARVVSSADVANTHASNLRESAGGRRCCRVSRSRWAAGVRVTSPRSVGGEPGRWN